MDKYVYVKKDTKINDYFPVPMKILQENISSTTMIIYGLLLNRIYLSKANNWVNEEGQVFIIYSNENMAKDIGKCETTVKQSLKELEEKGLIVRQRISRNSKRIYVLIPNPEDRKLSTEETENCHYNSQKSDSSVGNNMSTNNYIRNKKYTQNNTGSEIPVYTYREGESF